MIRLISESEKQRLVLSSLSDRQSALIAELKSCLAELGAQFDRLLGELERLHTFTVSTSTLLPLLEISQNSGFPRLMPQFVFSGH
jgi:hypothetical protein